MTQTGRLTELLDENEDKIDAMAYDDDQDGKWDRVEKVLV